MKSINEIDKAGLCIGCGICISLLNDNSSEMIEEEDGFLHPKVTPENDHLNEISSICPGVQCSTTLSMQNYHEKIWGPLKQSFLGHAIDEKIRWLGSSGGGITALLHYLLEKNIVDAVVQTGPDNANPERVKTYLNKTKEDVSRCASSRYCPSSPLSNINDVLSLENIRIAFVGRPCDVMALRHLLQLHPELQGKVKILITFFCASTPSYRATDQLIKILNPDSEVLSDFWYRGRGWPGFATAVTMMGNRNSLSYEKSWGEILSDHAHFRCKICPDGIGIFSDITFADAWELKQGKPVFEERDGRNAILVRTETGRKALDGAVDNGYLAIYDFDINDLQLMQPSQSQKRKIVGARLLALSICGLRYPKCKGLPVKANLRYARINAIVKNFLGTIERRLIRKTYK